MNHYWISVGYTVLRKAWVKVEGVTALTVIFIDNRLHIRALGIGLVTTCTYELFKSLWSEQVDL